MNRVLREILAIRATLEVGHRCPESFRQSDIDDSSWTDHYRHMAYFRPPFFLLECAFLHLTFRVWNFRWNEIKEFSSSEKRDLKQSVSVTNAGTVAQSDSVHSIKCTRISFLFESCWIHVTFKVIKLFMIWSHIIWLILYGPYNIGYVI